MPSGRSSEASAEGPDDLLELVHELLAAQRDTLWLGGDLNEAGSHIYAICASCTCRHAHLG